MPEEASTGAGSIMPHAARSEAAAGGHPEVTRDGFFDGRLVLDQPAKGHRSGTEAVLLAAAVPRDFAGALRDVGAGVGAIGLGAALLAPRAQVELVERDASVARLAAANIAANDLGDRVRLVVTDILSSAARRHDLPGPVDLVLTNPPFYAASRSRASPVEGRRTAHVLDADATTADWVRACLDLLAPHGTMVLIQRPDAVPEAVAALARGACAITLKSVHPRSDAPASRVLLRAVRGRRAPFAIAAPLVLHDANGFTREAEELHRGRATLAW